MVEFVILNRSESGMELRLLSGVRGGIAGQRNGIQSSNGTLYLPNFSKTYDDLFACFYKIGNAHVLGLFLGTAHCSGGELFPESFLDFYTTASFTTKTWSHLPSPGTYTAHVKQRGAILLFPWCPVVVSSIAVIETPLRNNSVQFHH